MPAIRSTRFRYLALTLVVLATALNAIDRANLSVAAPQIRHEFGLDPVAMGVLFSAYSWSYVVANIPGGWLADRFGSRVMYALALFAWSAFTFAQGFASRFAMLFGLRLGVGVAEAPTWPINNRVVTVWFPQRERGLATSLYVFGQYIGMAGLTPLLFWVGARFGWHAIFFATGGAGIAFAAIWYLCYRDPDACRWTSEAELAHIRGGGALLHAGQAAGAFSWRNLGIVFRNRQIVALCIGKFTALSSLYFFLTWFPSYLVTERHMTVIKAGGAAAIPFVGASIGVVVGGVFSDWLIRRGASTGVARKTPIIAGQLLVPCIALAALVHSNWLVIAIMSLSFFAHGVGSVSWTLVGEVAPRSMLGITGGAINLAGNLAGIVTPIAIGFILRETGTFGWALALIGVLSVIGALCYAFLFGKVERIVLDGDEEDGASMEPAVSATAQAAVVREG